jgi:hypothetical protein
MLIGLWLLVDPVSVQGCGAITVEPIAARRAPVGNLRHIVGRAGEVVNCVCRTLSR